MNLDEIVNALANREIPLNGPTLKNLVSAIITKTKEESEKDIYDAVFPVGRGFIDFTNTDYSKFLGLTWERELVNLTPIGCNESGSNVGDEKGTENHLHYGAVYTAQKSGQWIFGSSNVLAKYQLKTDVESIKIIGSVMDQSNVEGDNKRVYSYSTEESSSYQPSKIVAYWKRVA